MFDKVFEFLKSDVILARNLRRDGLITSEVAMCPSYPAQKVRVRTSLIKAFCAVFGASLDDATKAVEDEYPNLT